MVSRGEKYFQTEHLRSDLRRRTVRSAGATVFSNASVYVVQMVGTIVLARLLTPDDFGLITMITAFSILLQNFGMRGFTEATVQGDGITHKMVSTLFWIHIAISVGLALAFMAVSPAIAWFYGDPRLVPIAIAISANFLLFALATQHLALLMRSLQFYRIAAIEILANVLSVSLAILMAVEGAQYWSLVARRVSIPLGMVIFSWVLCRWLPGLPARGTGVKSMFQYGMNTYGNFTVNYLSRNVDKILLGWRHGTQSLGYYDRAYYLFVMPVNQLSYPLTNVAVSALSKLRDDVDKFKRYYLESLSILAFVGMPMSAMLTLIGKDFILLLLGPQWDKAGEVFTFFGPGIGIMLLYGTHGWLHLSLGRADRWFRWGILEMIVTILFFVAGLPFGASGVAIAYVLSILFLSGPGLWFAGRPISLSIGSLLGATWKYFAAALGAGLASWYLLHRYGVTAALFSGLPILSRMSVAIVLCGMLYLPSVILLYRSLEPVTGFMALIRDMVPGLPSREPPAR